MIRLRKQARWTGFVILGLVLMLAGRGESAGPVRAADGNNEKSPAPPPTPAYSADEETIREAVEAFVRAFNAGDAKAVVADWTADGQYTDEDGNVFRGRDAMEKAYARLFAAHPGATIAVSIESLRFQGAETAVEKGIARVTPGGGSAPTAARYTLVHVKRAGKWLLAVGHDAAYTVVASADHLKDLEWLIGQWRPDSPTESRQITFAWLGEKNFIEKHLSHRRGREDAAQRRADHRLEPQAGPHRLLALRRPGQFRQRPVDQGRLEVGDRGQRRLCRRQRVFGRQRHHAAGHRQLHLAVHQPHAGRRADAGRGTDQDRPGPAGQVRTLSAGQAFLPVR